MSILMFHSNTILSHICSIEMLTQFSSPVHMSNVEFIKRTTLGTVFPSSVIIRFTQSRISGVRTISFAVSRTGYHGNRADNTIWFHSELTDTFSFHFHLRDTSVLSILTTGWWANSRIVIRRRTLAFPECERERSVASGKQRRGPCVPKGPDTLPLSYRHTHTHSFYYLSKTISITVGNRTRCSRVL